MLPEKKTDLKPLCELSLEAPRLTAKKRKMASVRTVNPDMSFDAFQNDLHSLHDVFPEVTIFTSVYPTETDSASEGEDPNYLSVSSLFSQLSTSDISDQNIEKVTEKYKQYTITQEEPTCIKQATKSQCNSPTRHEHAAAFPSDDSEHTEGTLSKVMAYSSTSFTFVKAACTWGSTQEAFVWKKYESALKSEHEQMDIQLSGLVIHPLHPCVGASSNGICKCACHGNVLLEIKC